MIPLKHWRTLAVVWLIPRCRCQDDQPPKRRCQTGRHGKTGSLRHQRLVQPVSGVLGILCSGTRGFPRCMKQTWRTISHLTLPNNDRYAVSAIGCSFLSSFGLFRPLALISGHFSGFEHFVIGGQQVFFRMDPSQTVQNPFAPPFAHFCGFLWVVNQPGNLVGKILGIIGRGVK